MTTRQRQRATYPRWGGHATMIALALALGGCGSSPSMSNIWTMPQGTPTAPQGGYEWTRAGEAGVLGGDRGIDGPGDLPETALGQSDGFWLVDETRAQRQARASGKLMLIDFWAEWCQPCMRMQAESFPDAEVRAALLADYIPLRVDVTEETMLNREQLQRYDVARLPAVLIVNSRGEELDRLETFVSADELVERLASAAAVQAPEALANAPR